MTPLAFLLLLAPQTAPAVAFTPDEREIVLALSPVPEPPPDPSNAVYESPAAARLGQALFFDTRLSGPGTISCATCHDPERDWTDGRAVARGVSGLSRHTMTLWNVAYNRWFFWDGRKDTLWSQALGPLEDAREHASSRLAILHVLAGDAGYARAYGEVFGALPDASDERRFPRDARPVPGEPEHEQQLAWDAMSAPDQELATRVFVNVGKALAAYERTLVTRHAPFDRFVEGLRKDDAAGLAALDESAQRGLRLFVGKARCVLCHDGPNFTDLEFHDNRSPISEEGSDPGRKVGLRLLKKDPFNSMGRYADDEGRAGLEKLGFLVADSHAGKMFKTPTLRNVARTAPYMHEGQFSSLADVVRFYDTLEHASPDSGTERLIAPLGLGEAERADLVAFLESLTDESLPPELKRAPPTPYLSD